MDLIFYQLHISYREALVLVGVMLHIGEMYCLGMVPMVLICVILLQDCVRHPCNSIVPWDSIRALVASHLIALDKCPGVRPIGIGETLHRIIGKSVCLATHLDAALVCGSDHLCAGLQAGIEGAIHGMNELFSTHQDQGTGWGVSLVDAANVFNSLNQAAMLLHAHVICPRCAHFLIPIGDGQCWY